MDIEIPQTKNSKRNKLIVGVIAALVVMTIALVSISNWASQAPQVNRSDLWIETVQKGDLDISVKATGEVFSQDQKQLVATSEGTVSKILIRPGAQVTEDSVLLTLNNPKLSQQLNKAQLDLVQEEAVFAGNEINRQSQLMDQVSKLELKKVDFKTEQAEFQAKEQLFQEQIISRLDFIKSKNNLEKTQLLLNVEEEKLKQIKQSLEAQKRAEVTKIEKLQAAVSDLDRSIAELSIKAGFNGVLIGYEKNIKIGEKIGTGGKIGQVGRVDLLAAKLYISANQTEDLKVGMPASILINKETFAAKIQRIDPQVQEDKVEVDLEFTAELSESIKPNTRIDGVINTDTLKDVLYVVSPIGVRLNSKQQVFALDDDELLKTTVKFGGGNLKHISILSGLNEGDSVVLSDMREYRKHEKLTLND